MIIPVLDSATHPTLSGKWSATSLDASFSTLSNQMDNDQAYMGACALGLADIGDYTHVDFMLACKTNHRLIPIAGFNPVKSAAIESELCNLAKLGYKGIKIHPRLYGIDLFKHQSLMIDSFKAANKYKLTVFLCTYLANTITDFPQDDPYWQLVKILKETPETKIVLMHGGVTRVLQYAELARFNDNILLDLSYTLVKYQESSVGMDIRHLLRTFDRKICVGTDHPEFTLDQLRNALSIAAEGISEDKLINICHKNLLSFLDVKIPSR